MMPDQHRLVGSKILRSFYANCGYNVQTSAECKTDRSTVLTVMSGLDHHMINKLIDENKSWFHELWVVLLKSFLKWVGIYLHLVTRRSLIKGLTNIKMLTAAKP
jgi:hypothetical protein